MCCVVQAIKSHSFNIIIYVRYSTTLPYVPTVLVFMPIGRVLPVGASTCTCSHHRVPVRAVRLQSAYVILIFHPRGEFGCSFADMTPQMRTNYVPSGFYGCYKNSILFCKVIFFASTTTNFDIIPSTNHSCWHNLSYYRIFIEFVQRWYLSYISLHDQVLDTNVSVQRYRFIIPW